MLKKTISGNKHQLTVSEMSNYKIHNLNTRCVCIE